MQTQTHICLKEMGRARAMLDISNKIQSLKISFIRKTSFLDLPSARQRNKSDMLRPQRDFFPLSLMVLWLLQSNGGHFTPHSVPSNTDQHQWIKTKTQRPTWCRIYSKKQQKSQSGQAIKQTQTEMSKAYTDFTAKFHVRILFFFIELLNIKKGLSTQDKVQLYKLPPK